MADKYWISNTDSTWNTAANWNTAADGTGTTGVPASTDNVHFGHATTLGADLGNGACSLNQNETVVQFTSYEGYNSVSFSGVVSFTALINSINFGGIDPKELGFRVGMRIVVTNSVSNNGTHPITTITSTSVVVSTSLTTENNVDCDIDYTTYLDLDGNDLTLTTSGGTGILMTLDSVIKSSTTAARIVFSGGSYVSGSGSRYFLAGDNQNFEDKDDITMVFTDPPANMYFDDGQYPTVLLDGGDYTADYAAPTSSIHGKTYFHKYSEDGSTVDVVWSSGSGTKRQNIKKQFEVSNVTGFDLATSDWDLGQSTWTFDVNDTNLKLPVNGDTDNYGDGFNVRWYNLVIKNSSGTSSRKAIIPARKTLAVNSLTIEAGANLEGYKTQQPIGKDEAGASIVTSTTRPTIKGSWNFTQIADGIYSSLLSETYPITPSHGGEKMLQFSYDGGAFHSHNKILLDATNWTTSNAKLMLQNGAFVDSGSYQLNQTYAAASGSGTNNTIWQSNDTPSVLYYTDSAGTHHNLLAGGGGGGMTSWTLQGDSGSNQTITDGNTVDIAGGTGISTVAGATDTLTVNLNAELNDLTDVTITGTPTDLQVLVYDGTEWVNGWPEVKMIQIRNDEGSTIPAGAPLYSRGEIGGSNRILVGIADANDSAKMPCIGIAYEEMNTTTTQDNYGVVSGVYNTNLTGFTGLNDGDTVYVKNWTGTPTAASDVLTTTKPTGADEMIQNIGIILKTNSPTGTIIQGLLVSAIGRSNDIPNYLTFQSGAPTPAPTNTDVHIGYGNPYTETLSIRTQYGYLNIGARNAGYCHFYTDRNFFYFNRPLQFDGGDGVYAYNGDFWVRTDNASATPIERLTIKGAQNDTRIGIAQTNPQTELDVSGTIRQTNVTNAIVAATPLGDLSGVTIGSGLSFSAGTLSATGGGGGGYPLFKHDQLPTTHGFTPFRLLQNGDAIELGVVSGGDDNKDVSVFTPVNSDSVTIQVGIVNIGTVAANTGREYIFYGQGDRMMATQYIGGSITTVPIYFVESMRDVVLPAGGLFVGTHILEVMPMSEANCVRVIDAGVHSVLNASPDGGSEEPEEPTDVRILLIDDYKLYVDLRGGIAAPNYRLRT